MSLRCGAMAGLGVEALLNPPPQRFPSNRQQFRYEIHNKNCDANLCPLRAVVCESVSISRRGTSPWPPRFSQRCCAAAFVACKNGRSQRVGSHTRGCRIETSDTNYSSQNANAAGENSVFKNLFARRRVLLRVSSRSPAKRCTRGGVRSMAESVGVAMSQLEWQLKSKTLSLKLPNSCTSFGTWSVKRRGRVLKVIRCEKQCPPVGFHCWAPAQRNVSRLTSSFSVSFVELKGRFLVKCVTKPGAISLSNGGANRQHGGGSICSTSNYHESVGVSSQTDENEASENSSRRPTGLREGGIQRMRNPGGERKEEFLATGYGWRVRDAIKSEIGELRKVADIQTDAFHEPVALFDDFFYTIFHAEVLSCLQYKAIHSDRDTYACLLAESVQTEQFDGLEEPKIVGAVDITSLSEKDVVCHLPGAEKYLYVSGMAVASKYRRQNVATLLLEACLARALQWGFDYLVLHAYEDDVRARNLYSRAGFYTISGDPEWMTKFFGRRRRVVMAKRTYQISDSS